MKGFKYNVVVALILWVVIVVGTYVSDQKKIDACTQAGKVFEYTSFHCVNKAVEGDSSYLKVRYPIFVGTSVAVLLYVGAVTVFYTLKELRKHN